MFHTKWASSPENKKIVYSNNKGANQPAHPLVKSDQRLCLAHRIWIYEVYHGVENLFLHTGYGYLRFYPGIEILSNPCYFTQAVT